MATSAERLQQGSRTQRDDELLTHYMRALLRTGKLAEHGEDMRTCAHCGSYTAFYRAGEAGTWASCSACGELA